MVANWLSFLLLPLIVYHLNVQAQKEEEPNLREENLELLLKEVLKENKLLQQQVNYFLQRDIESDILEMKKLLETHTEEITNLRINQGHLTDSSVEHENHLTSHDNEIASQSQQLSGHSEMLSNHQLSIESNTASVLNHENTLNTHSIQIQANGDGVRINAENIQQNINNINKNSEDILGLSQNFNNFQSSLVRFHVESPCCQGYAAWPDNSRITFENKFVDSHNSHDGLYFTAPLPGVYHFIFTADMRMYHDRSYPATIHIRKNDIVVKAYTFDQHNEETFDFPSSLNFALSLSQGDRIDLVTTDFPAFDVSRNSATLSGSLVQKF